MDTNGTAAARLVLYSTALGATFGAISGRLRTSGGLAAAAPAAAGIIARRSMQLWAAAGLVHGVVSAGAAVLAGADTARGRLAGGAAAGIAAGLLQRLSVARTAALCAAIAATSALSQKSGP